MTPAGPSPVRAPLPARSVILSVLLGSHPPRLPVRTLVRTAGLFGIAEGTARVALSRLTADGEVVTDTGTYQLSERHLQRQADQDSALRPSTRPWRGTWDVVVLLPNGGAAGDLRPLLQRRRLAELRPGVWTRPDNLPLPPLSDPGDGGPVRWRARPDADPVRLAAGLWDLGSWADQARGLMAELSEAREPADRLGVAAAMVRHLRTDPVLPPALLPAGWPGRQLRRAYDAYRAELGALIAGLRDDGADSAESAESADREDSGLGRAARARHRAV